MKTLTKVLKAIAPSAVGLIKVLVLSMFFVSLLFLTSCANLIEATKKGDTASVKTLLNKSVDVNKKDEHGMTPLWWALVEGHIEIAKMLIDKGADVNAKDRYGNTALMWASGKGHIEIAKMLIDKGADVNAKDRYGNTALMKAYRNDHSDIAKVLIDKGADVNARNKWGDTALRRASEKGHIESAVNLFQTHQTKSYATGDDGDLRRGAAWPNPRFTVDGTGDCITDNLTGLMWVRSPDSARRTWQQALDYANDLTLCGYSDWRLPNFNELESLIDVSSRSWFKTALPLGNPFKNVEGHVLSLVDDFRYWSSSTKAMDMGSAWAVLIGDGYVLAGRKHFTFRVWPVRAGH